MDYLKKLPDDYELVVVSFFITNPNALLELRKQWAKRDREHKLILDSNSKKNEESVSSKTFGGLVCLLDPERLSQGFIAEIDCPVATGMIYRNEDKSLYVGSNKQIRKIKSGKTVSVLRNSLFNDIHGLTQGHEGNVLVVSTGVDAILEINPNNSTHTIWDWLATENGYSKNPKGEERTIDRNLDYQKIRTSTPEHTTHINGCLEKNDEKILATLFHQGRLIEIDKKTKKSQTLLDGLKCPHSIRKRNGGYIISDTFNNRVLLLDSNFKVTKTIEKDYNWVQDTIELGNGKFLLGDSNNTRIVKLDKDGNELEILYMEKDSRKIFSFLRITKKEALNIFVD